MSKMKKKKKIAKAKALTQRLRTRKSKQKNKRTIKRKEKNEKSILRVMPETKNKENEFKLIKHKQGSMANGFKRSIVYLSTRKKLKASQIRARLQHCYPKSCVPSSKVGYSQVFKKDDVIYFLSNHF